MHIAAIDLAGTDSNMATMFMQTAEEKFQILYKHLNDLLELETRLGQVTYDNSITRFNASLTMSVLVLAIAIGVSILLSLLIAKIITGPVRKAIEVIHKIAEGDLTQEIALTSTDEIGELAQSVDTMRRKMGEAVGGAVETSQTLSEAASEQAASIEETSSSLEEMSSMTKSNAAGTAKANGLMTGAMETIEKANTSMDKLTVSMREIAGASEETQKIVKTIDEISFQTNLLALNAAVEAARAGEAGAGFAVVAEEVRNLALRAAEAAKNSSTLMTDIVGKIRAGEQLVKTTNQEFVEIKTSSHKVVELMGGIAAASEEQSQGIDQINTAIQQMNSVTQENAASAEELAAIMATFITEERRYDGAEDPPAPKGQRWPAGKKEHWLSPRPMPDGRRAEIARAVSMISSNYVKEKGIMGISNMKLGARLALGFGVVLAMLAVGTFVGVNRLGAMKDSLNAIVNNDNKRVFLANEMVDQVRNVAISVRNIIVIDDKAFEGTEKAKLEKANGIFAEDLRKLAGMVAKRAGKKDAHRDR